MKTIRQWWQAIAARLSGQHTRALEEEIGRLRAENRALANSIHSQGAPKNAGTETRSAELRDAGPLRRRSWQQIGRQREIEEARRLRRERETDTGAVPVPRGLVVRN